VLIVPYPRRKRVEAMLRGARIEAQWIEAPTPQMIRRQDRERLLSALLQPAEFDDEDRELAARLMAERSPEDIAAALVHAHRAAMPQPEELIANTPEARHAAQKERHRPGFEDTVWFRMEIGRRQNADPRWILPLLCRRGHITRNEIGAIRIGGDETYFQVPRSIASKFGDALARTADSEDAQDRILIEQSASGPREDARENRRKGGPDRRPGGSSPHKPRIHRKGQPNGPYKGPGKGAGKHGGKPHASKKPHD
jgi:ATP-dependent RNA helicase DeaD